MVDIQTLVDEIYAAFNRRDVDDALARMSDTVSWPKASERQTEAGQSRSRAFSHH
jgi:hypothetical protein